MVLRQQQKQVLRHSGWREFALSVSFRNLEMLSILLNIVNVSFGISMSYAGVA